MRPAAATDPDRGAGLLALDVGTHKALALALRQRHGELRVCGWAERPFAAARDGVLVDIDAAHPILATVLDEAQRRGGLRTARVVASVGGGTVRALPARGSVRTKMPVLLQPAHLHRALDVAADIGLPAEHEILHVLPCSYEVDGARAVRRPVGMRASRLTAEARVVTVASLALDNLQRALEEIGYELVGAAAGTLAAARAALSHEDRRSGAVLIDIGAESLGAAVYRDGVFQALAHVALGGAHVTRDLAYALHLDHEAAEALKRRAGVARAEAARGNRQIEVQRDRESVLVGQQMLASVIEARMEEMLVLARDRLRGQQALALRDRVVLVGGGALLPGTVEFAEQLFEAPARIGAPLATSGWCEAEGDPSCCTALGLLEYASRRRLAAPERDAARWRRAVHKLRRALADGAGRRSNASRAEQARPGSVRPAPRSV